VAQKEDVETQAQEAAQKDEIQKEEITLFNI
jgi:hypothetical protein